eukprot:9457251-Ditylum_brightwellii.AAC.1
MSVSSDDNMKSLPKRSIKMKQLEEMEEDKEEVKSSNLNHNAQELDSRTEIKSSVKNQENQRFTQ